MMAAIGSNVEREGLCPFFLNTWLAWRPNEEEGDHDAGDSQYGDRIEHRDITSDEIPQLPSEKVSYNGSGAVRGKDEPVIRPVILGATKCGGARGRDCEPTPETEPQGTEPDDIDARGTRSGPKSKEYRGCCDNDEAQHRRISRVYPVDEVTKNGPTDAVEYGKDTHQGGSGRCAQLEYFLPCWAADANRHQAR